MTESMEWYLGSKKKPVGPMTATKVRKYIEKGKTSSKTRIRKGDDGDWVLLYEEPYFQDALQSASSDGVSEADGEDVQPFASDVVDAIEEDAPPPKAPPKKAPKAPKKKAKASADGEKKGLASFFDGEDSEPSYDPGYRFEKRDVWRAFSAGMTKTRVMFAFMILMVLAVIGGVFAGIAGIGAMIHPVASLIALGLGFAVMISVGNMGLGALSYHTRMALDGENIGVKDCFRFAFQNYAPLTMVPFVSTLLPMVPLILLVILAYIARIPYVGPVGTGLVFVIHILLGGLTVLFMTMAAVSWVFTPVLVAFGQTTVKGTLKALLNFLKTAAARFLFRSFWPSLGLSGFAFLVMFIGGYVVMVPVILTVSAQGGDGMKTLMSLMPKMGGSRGSYRGRSSRSSSPFAGFGSSKRSSSGGSSFFGGGGSAPTVPGLSGTPKKVEFADFVSNPSAYANQQIWFTASWREYKGGRVKLSGRGGNAKGTFAVHPLGRKKSGLFLGQVGFWARVTVSAKINKAGDYDYTYGQLLAVKLDSAKNAVRVYPTESELQAEARRVAREKAEAEARKRKKLKDAKDILAKFNAAIQREDAVAASAAMKDRRWDAVPYRDRSKYSNQLYNLKRKLATAKIMTELKALIAKQDFIAADRLLGFRNKTYMNLSRDQQGSLRSVLNKAKEELKKKLSKPFIVKLDDGTEVTFDFSRCLSYFHPKNVTFVERMSPNKKAKKPVKIRIEYRWAHSGVSKGAIDGGSAHREKGFYGTELGKTGSTVEVIIDQTRLKKNLVKFSCRAR